MYKKATRIIDSGKIIDEEFFDTLKDAIDSDNPMVYCGPRNVEIVILDSDGKKVWSMTPASEIK